MMMGYRSERRSSSWIFWNKEKDGMIFGVKKYESTDSDGFNVELLGMIRAAELNFDPVIATALLKLISDGMVEVVDDDHGYRARLQLTSTGSDWLRKNEPKE